MPLIQSTKSVMDQKGINRTNKEFARSLLENGFALIGRGRCALIFKRENSIVRLPKHFNDPRGIKNWKSKYKNFLKNSC